MKRILIALTLCAAGLPGAASAADDGGAYWSQRPENCRNFRRAMDADSRTPALDNIRNWVSGYLTAYNRMARDTYDILGLSEFQAAMQSIENYCKAHPLDNLSAAMEALTEEFNARRHQTKRQAGR